MSKKESEFAREDESIVLRETGEPRGMYVLLRIDLRLDVTNYG